MNTRSINAVNVLVFATVLGIGVTFLKTVVFSDFDIYYPEEQIVEQQEE